MRHLALVMAAFPLVACGPLDAVEARDRKPVRIASRFVGTDTFHQLVDALRARGVQVS